MRMNATFHRISIAGLATLALALPACGDSGGGSAEIEDDLAAAVEDVDIPSQEELEAEAEAAITDSNADAELEALTKAIEDDG